MADITLSYKGSTIATMSDSGSKTIQTAGKYCEGDIGLVYNKPQLIESWDFTNSLVGVERGVVASITDISQDSNGITFSTASGYLTIPISILPISIEIDVVSMNLTSTNHRRFVMFSTEAGLVYRASGYNKWGFYSGSWEMTNISSTSFFDNCTVKISVDSAGLWSVYKDGTLVMQSTVSIIPQSKYFRIGSLTDSINNTIISGLRVY